MTIALVHTGMLPPEQYLLCPTHAANLCPAMYLVILGVMFRQSWFTILAVHARMLGKRKSLVIEYFQEENRILREKLGNKKILLNDNQRRRLVVRVELLGRNVLGGLTTFC